MNINIKNWAARLLLVSALLSSIVACQAAPASPSTGQLKVIAVETFLADITQNVAGNRAQVTALIPTGLDPHAFEPTPADVAKITSSQVLVVNGASFEQWLDKVLSNADQPASGKRLVIEAARGLTARTPGAGELLEPDEHPQGDPHFWLDPTQVIHYVENIRDGLTSVDPQGKDVYAANAAAYIAKLQELDTWIAQQVAQIPAEKRQLITNHESFGYFADRYGFTIQGTIIPSTSTSAAPSAQQLAALIEHIRKTGAQAIFLETGANPQLAQQVARETGIKVVTDLYTHSTTVAGGAAPTYIDMMRVNVKAIVDALK